MDSSFLVPKISAKFDRGHPLRGHQMQVGWIKIGDFRQITGYISKTVQDRRMVSIKVEDWKRKYGKRKYESATVENVSTAT